MTATDAIPTGPIVADLFEGRATADVAQVDSSAERGLDGLLPLEREQVAGAAGKRQREFAAGRVCARRLLGEIGAGTEPLLSDSDRVPRWPDGVVGSISHSGDLCAVALAPRSALRALGLDLERAASVRRELWRRICRPAEIETLAAAPEPVQAHRATLLFSAKEATYKCLFPESRVALGFQDVEVELDLAGGRFQVRLERDAAPLGLCGDRLEGRFATPGAWVVTALALAQSA